MSTSKRPFFSLYFDTHLKEELNDYCFVLKVRVFPIHTQAEYTEDGEHFAND